MPDYKIGDRIKFDGYPNADTGVLVDKLTHSQTEGNVIDQFGQVTIKLDKPHKYSTQVGNDTLTRYPDSISRIH